MVPYILSTTGIHSFFKVLLPLSYHCLLHIRIRIHNATYCSIRTHGRPIFFRVKHFRHESTRRCMAWRLSRHGSGRVNFQSDAACMAEGAFAEVSHFMGSFFFFPFIKCTERLLESFSSWARASHFLRKTILFSHGWAWLPIMVCQIVCG